jgi:hypothetical protein
MSFEESDVWINKSKSGKSIVIYFNNVMHSLPIQAVDRVVNGESQKEVFSVLKDDKFVKSNVNMIKGGKMVIIEYDGIKYTSPISSIERLLNGEIKAVNLSIFTPDEDGKTAE